MMMMGIMIMLMTPCSWTLGNRGTFFLVVLSSDPAVVYMWLILLILPFFWVVFPNTRIDSRFSPGLGVLFPNPPDTPKGVPVSFCPVLTPEGRYFRIDIVRWDSSFWHGHPFLQRDDSHSCYWKNCRQKRYVHWPLCLRMPVVGGRVKRGPPHISWQRAPWCGCSYVRICQTFGFFSEVKKYTLLGHAQNWVSGTSARRRRRCHGWFGWQKRSRKRVGGEWLLFIVWFKFSRFEYVWMIWTLQEPKVCLESH